MSCMRANGKHSGHLGEMVTEETGKARKDIYKLVTLQVSSKETENVRVGKLGNGEENAYNHGMSILVTIFVKHIVTTQYTRG